MLWAQAALGPVLTGGFSDVVFLMTYAKDRVVWLKNALEIALTISLFVVGFLLATNVRAEDATPTPEEYASHVGAGTKLLQPGEFTLDGRPQRCGQRPVVIDDQLDDYGAAYPGFLIMNSRLLERVSSPVKQWIFAHECGHQFRGPDEETADCFAVQRGRRYGWLTPEGLDEVCNFISPAKGDSMHFSGSHRCEYMRKCYDDPTIK